MPSPAEDEAERLKREQEEQVRTAKINEAADRQRQIVNATMKEGMAKEQTAQHAAPTRPDHIQKSEQYKRDEAIRQRVLDEAARNEQLRKEQDAAQKQPQQPANQPRDAEPTYRSYADQPAVREEPTKAEERQKSEQVKADAVKAAAELAERQKTDQQKTEKEKQGERAKDEAMKADVGRATIERKAELAHTQAQQMQPRSFAERRALGDAQAAQQAQQGQQQERLAAVAGIQRYAERRAAQTSERSDNRPPQEASDFRQRQAQREAERPAREETEKRQSMQNSTGKDRDKDGNER
jgi:hypothetical protein